jgi:hypothetical protein
MTQEEAVKILNIKDQASFTPEEVMKVCAEIIYFL